MKLSLLIPSAIALSLSLGCSTSHEPIAASESAVSGVPIGEVRGVVDVTNALRIRLFDDTDPTTAKLDVSRVAGPVFKLRKQLGVFATEGTTSTYLGGTPTPLRMTLWHQVFARFATAMGTACLAEMPAGTVSFQTYAEGPQGDYSVMKSFKLHPDVYAKVKSTCAFAGDETARRKVASDLFDAVMGYGGTLAPEKAAFEAEFATEGSPTVTASPSDRVADMMLALLLNPHFLLAK
jgi:hypothetical protein